MMLSVVAIFFCAHMIGGTTTWLVNQILAFPLRPVRIRPALAATRKKWKKLIGRVFSRRVLPRSVGFLPFARTCFNRYFSYLLRRSE